MNIESKLAENGIKIKTTKYGNQKTKCPQCQPPHDSHDTPLSVSINDEGAVWLCHHCEWKGGTGTNSYTQNNYVKKPLYVRPSTPNEPNKTESMYSFFAKRGIHKETVDALDLYVEGSWLAFPYLNENNEVVNIKYRTRDKKFKQSPNAERTLFNYQNAKDTDSIIFVEGEMDVLSLYEVGFTNAVSLPDGAPKEAKFKKDDARFKALENCPLKATNIIIFTDNDQAGKSLHDELLHRFGKDVCWYVQIPNDCKDANDVLLKHGTEKLKQIIDQAVPYPVDGLYTANQYSGSVIDLYNGNYVKPVEVGYPSLDEIYKIMKGTFHCITGVPNHGKSYFLDQMLIKLAQSQQWSFALFSPEHSTSMHIRRMVQMYNEKPFDIGEENRMTKYELEQAMEWLHNHFYFIETQDTVPNIDYILEIAKASVLKYGINGIVIDPYNEVSAVRQGNQREDEHIRDFISKCKRFARVHDIVVWVVAHPTKLQKNNDGGYSAPSSYDISGASHWSNQSDCILTIHRDFDENTTQVLTRKIREQDLYGKIGSATFKFDTRSRVFKEYRITTDFEIPQEWGNT
jgi:twinkle protein